MKKISLLLFVPLLISQLLSAQLRLEYGVKGGGGQSLFIYKTYTNLQGTNKNWPLSCYGGLFGHISYAKLFFQPELLYSMRGMLTKENYVIKRQFHYVSIPLLIGFKPFKKFSIMAGPELGRLIYATSKNDPRGKDVTKYVDHRNSIDLDFGLAWALNSKLAIEARYVHGLTPLYDIYLSGRYPTTITGKSDEDGYNRVLQLGLTYRLNKLK